MEPPARLSSALTKRNGSKFCTELLDLKKKRRDKVFGYVIISYMQVLVFFKGMERRANQTQWLYVLYWSRIVTSL